METKKTLRKKVLERRDAMLKIERNRKSARICEILEQELTANFKHPNIDDRAETGVCHKQHERPVPLVAAYAPMRSEVDVRPFVESAYQRGWRICFPCMVRDRLSESPHMEFYQVKHNQLKNAWEEFLGHPLRSLTSEELAHSGYEHIAPHEIDGIVVPLVAFDKQGGRLGYGGGNYDRLLPCVRKNAVIIGVAFDEQCVSAVPVEQHDRPLSRIITA